jgi:hypothetical protein
MIVGGHITELFDHWDHTLETGTEIDFAVVLVAAAGASVLLAVAAAKLIVLPFPFASDSRLTAFCAVSELQGPTHLHGT